MPDISKIKLENDIYNIKDATARAGLQSIETITQAEVDQITNDAFDSFPSPVYGYDTVADMQADPDLQKGMICHTSGFHTAGDGGAAYYKISNSGTANEMDVLACGDLFATLIYEGTVMPEQLGAYGDGSENDCSAVLQRLVNKGKTIHGTGSYYISDSVTLINGTKVYLNRLAYGGTDYAFIVNGSRIRIDVPYFISTTGGFVRASDVNACSYIYINSSNCNAQKHCIDVELASATCTFWYINGRYTTYDAVPCVYMATSASDVYATEMHFIDCNLGTSDMAAKGISLESTAGALQVCLTRTDLERSSGVYLNNVNVFKMDNCRGAEVFSKTDWLETVNCLSATSSLMINNCPGTLRLENISFTNSTAGINVHSTYWRATDGNGGFIDGTLYDGFMKARYSILSEGISSTPELFPPRAGGFIVPYKYNINATSPLTIDLKAPYFGAAGTALYDHVYFIVRNNTTLTVNAYNNAGTAILKTLTLGQGTHRVQYLGNYAWGVSSQQVAS